MELYTARNGNFDIGYLGYNDYYGNVTQQQCPVMLAHAQYLGNEDDFKKELISNGPMHTVVDSWGHEMLLVGYYTAKDWVSVDNCDERLRDNGVCSAEGCLSFQNACDARLVGAKECYQNELWECTQTEGGDYMNVRIAQSCTEPSCPISEVGNSKCLNDSIYQCTNEGINPYWKKINTCAGICVNNQCVSSTATFNSGDKRCIRNGGDNHYVYQQYTPGSNQTYWTFKNQNQGGVEFGDQGFINISIPYTHLISGIYFKGPFTLPTNASYIPASFDGTINCEDLDSDNYCNWGISETKPSTCNSSCKTVKDCDDSNPNLNHYDENMNCVSDIDLGITASDNKVLGSTYDLSITIDNTGEATAKNVVMSFMKSYDLIISTSGFSCTVNEAEFTVTCSISSIAPNSTVNGIIRMTSLDPGSRYDLNVYSTSQVDPNISNNTAVISLSNPVQQCEVTFKGNTSMQDCMDIDNVGTYYSTRGDLIRIVCTGPADPIATGCTYHFQIQNMQSGIKVVDTASGNAMLWGQGGTDNTSPKLMILSENNLPIGEMNVVLEDNLDWATVQAGTENTIYKSFVHNLTGAPGATDNYSLFIPYRNQDTGVGICINADSFTATGPSCPGLVIKHEADADTEIVTINGIKFWKVIGLTGTGGYSIQGSLLTRTGDSIIVPMVIGFGLLILAIPKRLAPIRLIRKISIFH